MMRVCGYGSKADFARALGLKNAQNIAAWASRDTFGEGALQVSEVTGADMKWLATGRGEPFPDGPKLSVGGVAPDVSARLDTMERDLGALVSVVGAALRRFSATTPGAAEGVLADLEKYLQPGRPSAVVEEVVSAVRDGLRQAELAERKKKPRSRR